MLALPPLLALEASPRLTPPSQASLALVLPKYCVATVSTPLTYTLKVWPCQLSISSMSNSIQTLLLAGRPV